MRMQSKKVKPPATNENTGIHASSEIFVPGVVAFLVFIAFSAFVMHAGIWGWLKTLQAKRGGSTTTEQRQLPAVRQNSLAGPRLQINPRADLELYRKEQNELLNNYSWFDRTAGLVRVPINQAIDRVLVEGLPHWGPTNRRASQLELQARRPGGDR